MSASLIRLGCACAVSSESDRRCADTKLAAVLAGASAEAEAALLMRQAHDTLLPLAPWHAPAAIPPQPRKATRDARSSEAPQEMPQPRTADLLHADAVLVLLQHESLRAHVPRECVILAAAAYAAAGAGRCLCRACAAASACHCTRCSSH